jgi:hypothetical protein
VRTARFGASPTQPLAPEGLALNDSSDLVTIDVEIADPRSPRDHLTDGIDAAVEPECQAVAAGINSLDDLADLAACKTNDVEDWTKILAI